MQIDSQYTNEARQFEQQLQSRNQIAAQAYRQARGLKARARQQQAPEHEQTWPLPAGVRRRIEAFAKSEGGEKVKV